MSQSQLITPSAMLIAANWKIIIRPIKLMFRSEQINKLAMMIMRS